MKLFNSDLSKFTSLYRSYIGGRWLLFLVTAIIPALLDGVGISMIIPFLKIVANGQAGTPATNDGTGGNSDIAFEVFNFLGLSPTLNNVLILICTIYIIKFVINFLNSNIRSFLYTKLVQTMRFGLYSNLMDMDYSVFKAKNTGYYINLVTSQMGQFLNGFLFLTNFYTKLFTSVTYLVISIFIDWKFTVFAVLAGGSLVFVYRTLNKKVKSFSRQTSKEEGLLTAFFIQSMQAFKYLAATAGFKIFSNKVANSVGNIRKQRIQAEIRINLILASFEPMSMFTICGLIFVMTGYLNVPLESMILSVLLFHRAYGQLIHTQKDWQYVLNVSGGILAVHEEFMNTSSMREKSGGQLVNNFSGDIEFKNVSYSYGDHAVLKDVNLLINSKTMVALVGESGAGKTTLADIVSLVLKPNAGNVFINGLNNSEVNLTSWRENIGYISQDVQLFDDTVANNISLWKADYNTPEGRERIEWAAKMAHCHEFISKGENGYNAEIGDRGLKLSGGQKQRLAIARELFKNPSVLIMDEATSALDSESEQYIKETLHKLKGSLTVIMIAHRLSTVKEADMIVVMDNGEVRETGSFNELMEKDGYFKKIVEMQKL